MSQNKFEKPLDLALKPSRLFYSYLSIVFICSLVSLYIADALAFNIRLSLFLLFIVSFALMMKNHFATRISNIILTKNDEWQVITKNNERFEVELFGECIVTYFIIWLNFRTCSNEGGHHNFHVLLSLDSADKEQLRQLRVRLRFLDINKTVSPLEE